MWGLKDTKAVFVAKIIIGWKYNVIDNCLYINLRKIILIITK